MSSLQSGAYPMESATKLNEHHGPRKISVYSRGLLVMWVTYINC